MEKHLDEQYGFQGREIVLRRKALIYWSRDKFEKTHEILNLLLSEAKKLNDNKILSRTIYTKARVDENEGKIDQAIASYERFVLNFGDSENVGEAMTSLVMLHTLSTITSFAVHRKTSRDGNREKGQ